MLRKIRISNFKSINQISLEIGRINVFIGENGVGKSNILEAIAMAAASKNSELDVEGLYNKGMRVTKPSLTFSSFLGKKQKDNILIELSYLEGGKSKTISTELKSDNPNVLNSKWIDQKKIVPINTNLNISDETIRKIQNNIKSISNSKKNLNNNQLLLSNLSQLINDTMIEGKIDRNYLIHIFSILSIEYLQKGAPNRIEYLFKIQSLKAFDDLTKYVIYNLNIKALRGIVSESKKQPLGINGENLDILISRLTKSQYSELVHYFNFISWLMDIIIDSDENLKFQDHKLGKSISNLYFKDKFMLRKNNIFSAENANEGVLHVLFYLVLFISDITPNFFGIDNIESSLNPQLCRSLIQAIAKLAKKHDKQALITTHNPAILDGLNLHDDDQRLFVVSRTDEGFTKIDRIKLKSQYNTENLKLSEMWMRGYLGGIPTNF